MPLIVIQDSATNVEFAEIFRNDIPAMHFKTEKSKVRKSSVNQMDITPNGLFVKVYYNNDNIILDPLGIDTVGGIPITDVYSLYDALGTYLNI